MTTDPNLKRPINDVNVLKPRDGVDLPQLWLMPRIHASFGPNFDTVDKVLNYIRENLAEAPLWKLRVGHITPIKSDEKFTQITITIATRKPASRRKGDCIGRCVQQGSIEEVWPAFCTYVRML